MGDMLAEMGTVFSNLRNLHMLILNIFNIFIIETMSDNV